MNSKPKAKCHSCNSDQIHLFTSYPDLVRVTSDCKSWPNGGQLSICSECCIVQKVINLHWRAEIQDIYSNYELFHQSQGQKEQPVFNCATGESAPRSHVIMDYANSKIVIGENFNIIDIGCGVGNTLKSLGNVFPNARLYGFEPYVRDMHTLKSIKNVQEIYTDQKQFSDQKFDLMTMFHVLEHIEGPKEILRTLAATISKNGHLIIAVPDYQANPFDLTIADHASHFSIDSLRTLLETSGWEIVDISNVVINKELLAICKPCSQEKQQHIKPHNHKDLVEKQIAWMTNTIAKAHQIASQTKPFGIFGTSIAANWLYGAIKEKVDFFVDEDPDRADRIYHDKPVYHSSKIPSGSHIFVCLQPGVAEKVTDRLKTGHYFLYLPSSYANDKNVEVQNFSSMHVMS